MIANQRLSRLLNAILGAVVLLSIGPVTIAGKRGTVKRIVPQIARQPKRRPESLPRRNTPAIVSIEPYLGDFRSQFANGNYEHAFMSLANVAGGFYDQNNFPAAMQAYRIFANFADPFTTIDPSDVQEEAIRKSTVIKDMSRNYVKFMLNTQQVHPELCRTTNCVELAWNMMEKIKSRLLRLDLINSAFSHLEPNKRAQIDGLIKQIKTERIARSKLRVATGNLLGPTEKDSTIATLENEIGQYLPAYTNLAGEIASLQQVRESLTDNETLLSFVYTNNERKVYVFKVEKNGSFDPSQTVIKTDILTIDLFDAVERIKKAMMEEESLEAMGPTLHAVYSGVFDKIHLQGNRRLIIATDQNLSALPFDIFPLKDGRTMSDVFDIIYVPSATVFYHLRRKRTTNIDRNISYLVDYAGFGYTGEERNRLIHTDTEIDNAARYFSRNPSIDNSTEAEIYRHCEQIANARYLHFATHNYSEPGIDASFYLAFGRDENQDGRLTSQEIITKLRNRAELTVLSSCETAQANDNYPGAAMTPMDPKSDGQYTSGIVSNCVCSYGESFSNLSGAFFAAGSKELLLTQWQIRDDKQTDIFISKFFGFLASGSSPSQALKKTKKNMQGEKPVLWAGFILAGD
jgi:CHAT domain-containing protein